MRTLCTSRIHSYPFQPNIFPSTHHQRVTLEADDIFPAAVDGGAVVLRMSQRAFIESVVSRYGVESSYDLAASQSTDLGPRKDDE